MEYWLPMLFDTALFELYQAGMISEDDALRNADSVNDIRLRFKLESEVARKTVAMHEAIEAMEQAA